MNNRIKAGDMKEYGEEEMSHQERLYVDDFAASAKNLLNVATGIHNKMRDVFFRHHSEPLLKTFQGHLARSIEDANRMHHWALGNHEMNRFPASKSELVDAINLTLKITRTLEKLGRCYEELYTTKKYFAEFATLGTSIAEASIANSRLYVLAYRAETAVSDANGVVDKSRLLRL